MASAYMPVMLCSLAACGGAPDAAKHGLSVASIAVRATDDVVAERYAIAAAEAYDAATSLADYREQMTGWDAAERALRTARAALFGLQSALDAWDDAGEGDWPGAAACLSKALLDVRSAIVAVGVTVPAALLAALELGGFFAGECHVD